VTKTNSPRWLEWAREIQALSQTGLTYSENDYQTQRYRRLMEIAAEIVESHTDLLREQVLQDLVIRDNRILLVQECADERWCMPGGWADVGDLPSKMAEREVWEESGFKVVARKVIGVYDANRSGVPLEFYHAYKIVFLCEIIGGQARPSNETLAVDFFSFDDLPPLSAERTNERHLAEVFAHLRDRHRPVAFD
jgi:ADP-ribose pyrophosphatase YjhB (NUDIX family)